MSPYDINPNNAEGRPATSDSVWGINNFQKSHMGGDIF